MINLTQSLAGQALPTLFNDLYTDLSTGIVDNNLIPKSDNNF
jgi:hypothetical protein